MSNTTKTLTYKVARFNKEMNGKTLQDLLNRAIKKRKTALSRRQQLESEGHFNLINFTGPHQGMRIGEFFDYTHGHKQPLAKFEEEVEALEISSLAPPDQKSDFLHSILYFGVWNNSVIISQSMTLRSLQFEAYLNWLLVDCGLLNDGDFLHLADNPPLDKAHEIVNTRGIEFHAPITFDPVSKGNKKGQTEETKSIEFIPKNIGWELLQKIIPPELTLPKKVKANQILLDEALEVKLRLSWSRLNKDDPTALLDGISNQLRHIDTELDYTIETKSGKITPADFKLNRKVSVPVNSDGLIRRLNMWDRMKEWLDILISEEQIVDDA